MFFLFSICETMKFVLELVEQQLTKQVKRFIRSCWVFGFFCHLGQLRCRRGQKLIDVVAQRLPTHGTHHSQLLLDESQSLFK